MSLVVLSEPAGSRPALFTRAELARVGTTVTMMVVLGTAIIVAQILALGHYNSLAHCAPKAMLDGAALTLLLGRRGRWRCLALLGVVYGLVLCVQIGVVYLIVVMAAAGFVAAAAGRLLSPLHRILAVAIAAILYELLAGGGTPLRILFGTRDGNEPLLWALWLAEWPLRIAGAAAGVWLARRWAQTPPAPAAVVPPAAGPKQMNRRRPTRTSRPGPAGARLAASMAACIVPMAINDLRWLGILALGYLLYAAASGLRQRLLSAAAGLIWSFLVFALASYLWHHDPARVLDLFRTFVLRFAPLTFSSLVLVSTVRPVAVIRLLRRLGVPGFVLLPLAQVARCLPESQRQFQGQMAHLRTTGVWRGPLSALRHPRQVFGALFGPPLRHWAGQLAEHDAPRANES